MATIKPLTDAFCVSPQIQPEELAELKAQGFSMIINNRPDGEEPGQPTSKAMHAAADAAGLAYAHVPVGHGISPSEVAAMQEALDGCDGKVLAFCRSGTRSTLLWAIAKSEAGADRAELEAAAQGAGYDLAPISHLL